MFYPVTILILLSIRLSGVLHVLYYTIGECLKNTGSDADSEIATEFLIPSIIPEEVAQMAVHLTEYYQSQRLAYEEVISPAELGKWDSGMCIGIWIIPLKYLHRATIIG